LTEADRVEKSLTVADRVEYRLTTYTGRHSKIYVSRQTESITNRHSQIDVCAID
jgi:hypothetical protein